MEELIKVTPSPTTGNPVVNARDLYKFLDVGQEFSPWIKDKIEKWEFTENQDYACIYYDMYGKLLKIRPDKNIKSDNQEVRIHKTEYALTLDTAKEIAMVQNSGKGKEIRKYFIEVEKQYKELKLKSPEPILVLSNNTHTIAEVAILLSENKTGKDKISSHQINIKLRENKYFKPNNKPYQKWVNQGFFAIEQYNPKYYSAKRITVTDNKGLPVIQQLFGESNQLSPVVIKNNVKPIEQPIYNNQPFINEGRLTRLEKSMVAFINLMLASKDSKHQIENDNYKTQLRIFKAEIEKQNSDHKSIELI